MVDRREYGADQSRDQGSGHESANRRTDGLTAESTGEENNAAAGNSAIFC